MAGKAGRRIYRGKRWQRVRRAVFDRDGWRCTACGAAGRLECDHIRPVAKGGDWYAMDNLRTLCRSCHIQATRAAHRRPVSPDRAELWAMAESALGGHETAATGAI